MCHTARSIHGLLHISLIKNEKFVQVSVVSPLRFPVLIWTPPLWAHVHFGLEKAARDWGAPVVFHEEVRTGGGLSSPSRAGVAS